MRTIHALPEETRPRERLIQCGAEALADYELIACVLGRGSAGRSILDVAQQLLQRCGSLTAVCQASWEELADVAAMGPVKSVQLKAAYEVGRRTHGWLPTPGVAITTTAEAVTVARHIIGAAPTERVIALLLDARHALIRSAAIAVGTLTASVVHPREVFHEAVRARAAAVIVAHNHPSGDATPSEEDVALTRQFVAAGEMMGIPVLDHIVIAGNTGVSIHEWLDTQ